MLCSTKTALPQIYMQIMWSRLFDGRVDAFGYIKLTRSSSQMLNLLRNNAPHRADDDGE
jgi:hypothetical protein